MCPSCAVGGVLAFREAEDGGGIDDLFESVGLVLVALSDDVENDENSSQEGSKQAENGTEMTGNDDV